MFHAEKQESLQAWEIISRDQHHSQVIHNECGCRNSVVKPRGVLRNCERWGYVHVCVRTSPRLWRRFLCLTNCRCFQLLYLIWSWPKGYKVCQRLLWLKSSANKLKCLQSASIVGQTPAFPVRWCSWTWWLSHFQLTVLLESHREEISSVYFTWITITWSTLAVDRRGGALR